ncbi:MipA/OmpV family protein [Palleronia abyssalis]|uniref:MltA-interacting protein n=1 Tax=Palleronia abyssalis TaxID=1501240 RepID=A0A2R8BXB5_9RHOB|nr:MipA/OmpV family protein [Palleronia abyssalis]SPJ24790.1 hypothetical protein PAA8504_02628 [Palleronia abyssalis]
MLYRFATAATLSLLAPAAFAGDLTLPMAEPAPVYAAPAPAASPNLVFTLSGGIAVKPEYFGSEDYTVGPSFGFGLNFVDIGPVNFGSADPYYQAEGLGLRGSFRYVDERSEDDSPELAGLDDVDETYELGLGVGYQSVRFDAFLDVRYGIGGHESFVGEVGADVKANPSERLTLSAGPRLLFGTDDYASTYFDVDEATSTLSQYDADGGLMTAGVEVGAKYRITDNWGVQGALTYDRFVGDAKDSPIVQQGSEDSYGLSVGLTRRITLDF